MFQWSVDAQNSILFDVLFNPSIKMATSLANIAKTTARTSKFIY